MARLDLLQELIASTNWTLEVEPLRLRNVTFSYMQLRSLDMRDVKDKYIVLDMSTADALATVLKQVGRLDLRIKLNEDLSEWITLRGGMPQGRDGTGRDSREPTQPVDRPVDRQNYNI